MVFHMRINLTIMIAALAVLPFAGQAQTTVIARPISDANNCAVFQVTQIVRTEGTWPQPLVIGQLLYPRTATKAYPLSRFGEAIVIALSEPGNFNRWQGIFVHNGYIPALNGISVKTLLKSIASRPVPARQEIKAPPVRQLSECPICHQMHLHI